MTAIAYAAEKKSANIIQKLLNYQAELAPALQTLNSRDAEAVQFLCEQSLVFKMAKNTEEEVGMLVRYHPQIALAKHPIGLPFVFHALSLNQENIAFSLLAKDNTYAEPIEGKYLLLEAIKAGADSMVEELILQRNTPVNIQDTEESSPLHLAVHHDNRRITVLLLSERHPLNAIDRNDRTPLHIALLEGRKDLASMLIGNGADLTLKDNKDWQPVHMAAYSNDLNHLGLLIERGADVNARGESGMTPLHYAAQNADLPMIEYLLAAGADKTVEDYFGRTPYKIVKKARQRELAKWLK
jgi:ankyrin repeat protein